MNETPLSRVIIGGLASIRALRLFRNNTGMAWAGTPIKKWTGPSGDEFLTIRNARPVKFGLAVGSSDWIGWYTVMVTPEMVGQRVAVFTAMEFKRPKRSKRSGWQRNFIEQVNKAGGRAGFATSLDEARQIIGE